MQTTTAPRATVGRSTSPGRPRGRRGSAAPVPLVPRLTGALLALLALALLARPAQVRAASAPGNGLALTPYMGWNSTYGSTPLYEQIVLHVADTMVARGLRDAGYRYLWLDATWWDGVRDADGAMVAPPRQWPHGLRYLTDYIHDKGLLAGIYTDAGADGCGGSSQGSGPAAPGGVDHYQQDADSFAAWGFDAVKVDFCGGSIGGLDPRTQFTAFGVALAHNSSHRQLLYNICNPFTPAQGETPLQDSAYWSYTFAPTIANSWRTEFDLGLPDRTPLVTWDDMLRNAISDAAHPEVAGPGHWNDPDYLVPELGMTASEDQTQATLWAMLAAPFMIGSDIRTLSDASIAMLTNRELIALDQDAAGSQGIKLSDTYGEQVWLRSLADPASRAVALLNTSASARAIGVRWQDLGLSGPLRVRDLWSHRDLGVVPSGYAVTLPAHAAALLLVRGAPTTTAAPTGTPSGSSSVSTQSPLPSVSQSPAAGAAADLPTEQRRAR